VVKLGTLISAFVVLTLLILLAPVAILGPPQNVAAQPEAVTEEIEASFSFSVVSGGAWHDFEAGSAVVQSEPGGVPRIALVQYTRPNVVIPGLDASVKNCSSREYTTGLGAVTSTVGDLTGDLTLEWITVNFNKTYTHTPKYDTTDHFGWMMVRGHFIDGDDSFAFVWIADFDSDDTIPTSFVGKGFMQSVEENGRFGDMSDPIEQRHHIMGDLDIALSGGTYTGTFHLRNYPPNEVEYVGMINITGGVMQEFTDDISAEGLEIMNVTSDGSMFTPADEDYPTGFEEIDWGKDPPKVVADSDRLGGNGTMNLTRNSIMYLNQSVSGGTTYITIQVDPVCILHIDDTYAVTNDDGTPYGELYEILLLSLPRQYLPLGQYFNQSGYTFCPFGTVNGQPAAQTGLYEGAESFADAVIYIESAVGNSLQHSHDWSYGLYPHPVVPNHTVAPNKGAPGATMNVTITGKYFLKAKNKAPNGTPIPNSGSVSFGPNITVTNYKIDNDNPANWKDNSITATITIDGDAPVGARNVTVTSCFGYANGNGAGPYKSGTLVDGFTIEAAGTSLDGHVGLSGFPATNVTVRLFTNGTTTEAAKAYGATNGDGDFTITGLPSGTYDIAVKGQTSLSNLLYGVDLSVAGTKDFGVLREGDAGSSNDDYIDGSDYGPLSSAWNSYPGITPPPAWDPDVDFSRDNYIDGSDYGPVSSNWNGWGDTFGWPGNWN